MTAETYWSHFPFPDFTAFFDLEAIDCIAKVFNYKVSSRIFAQKDRDDLPHTAPSIVTLSFFVYRVKT